MRTIAFILCLTLTACAYVEAGEKNKASREALVACLEKNQSKPSKCDALARIHAVHNHDWESRNEALQSMGNNNSVVYDEPERPRLWMQNMGGKTYNCNNIGGTVNCF